jgi:hypothetical protein
MVMTVELLESFDEDEDDDESSFDDDEDHDDDDEEGFLRRMENAYVESENAINEGHSILDGMFDRK